MIVKHRGKKLGSPSRFLQTRRLVLLAVQLKQIAS